ncbi:hypothetical protein J1N35_025351, partial [Gossypium stocksii]
TISVPSQFLVDSSGQVVENHAFLAHNQQEKLLASWLFSTLCDEVLVYLTSARMSRDI